jgi:hypothetical protein
VSGRGCKQSHSDPDFTDFPRLFRDFANNGRKQPTNRGRSPTIGQREFGAERGKRAGDTTAHPSQDKRT